MNKIDPIFLEPMISDGRSVTQFLADIKKVGSYAKSIMLKGKDADGKPAFVPTSGVKYKPVILRSEAFSNDERTTSNIQRYAKNMRFGTPPLELGPLSREAIPDDDLESMHLWWLIVMHEPVGGFGDGPRFLGLRRGSRGGLLSYVGRPGDGWIRRGGFMFLAPQD